MLQHGIVPWLAIRQPVDVHQRDRVLATGVLEGELGQSASAAGVADAIDRADAVIFAVWLNVL